MKMHGDEVTNDNIEKVYIPRKTRLLTFVFVPIIDWEEKFKALCPEPKAPLVTYPGGRRARNIEDSGYKAKITDHVEQRIAYQFLLSIGSTEGLVWDTVDITKPETWLNYKSELTKSGFTESEQNLLFEGYMKANTLSETHLKKATDDFLLQQAAEMLGQGQSSQDTEPPNTPSGEPVND